MAKLIGIEQLPPTSMRWTIHIAVTRDDAAGEAITTVTVDNDVFGAMRFEQRGTWPEGATAEQLKESHWEFLAAYFTELAAEAARHAPRPPDLSAFTR